MRAAAALRQQQHRAAVALQAAARGWLERRAAAERLRRVVRVQAAARGYLGRRQAAARRAVLELEAVAKLYMIRCSGCLWWFAVLCPPPESSDNPFLFCVWASGREQGKEEGQAFTVQRQTCMWALSA